jgi:hypothetical protein
MQSGYQTRDEYKSIVDSLVLIGDRVLLERQMPTKTTGGIHVPQTVGQGSVLEMTRYFLLKKGSGPVCDKLLIGEEIRIMGAPAHRLIPDPHELYVFDASAVVASLPYSEASLQEIVNASVERKLGPVQ